MSRDLPFTTNNKRIKRFRHALALDERRAKFVPTFWHIPSPGQTQASNPPRSTGSAVRSQINNVTNKAKKNSILSLFRRVGSESSADIEADVDPEEDSTDTCDVKEVWFVGAHSGESE